MRDVTLRWPPPALLLLTLVIAIAGCGEVVITYRPFLKSDGWHCHETPTHWFCTDAPAKGDP